MFSCMQGYSRHEWMPWINQWGFKCQYETFDHSVIHYWVLSMNEVLAMTEIQLCFLQIFCFLTWKIKSVIPVHLGSTTSTCSMPTLELHSEIGKAALCSSECTTHTMTALNFPSHLTFRVKYWKGKTFLTSQEPLSGHAGTTWVKRPYTNYLVHSAWLHIVTVISAKSGEKSICRFMIQFCLPSKFLVCILREYP